jgi:hypothetical protein
MNFTRTKINKMAKTKRLSIYCNQARSFSSGPKVIVHLEEPDINDALLSFHSDDLIAFMRKHYAIEETFSKQQLNKWAKDNGYIKQ